MGRDKTHAAELTDEIRRNAATTVALVNELLAEAEADGVIPGTDSATGTPVASGWRPAGINARTANAAKKSTHMFGLAVDLQDIPPVRPLARWCLKNQVVLERLGLWMERPQWTAGTNGRDPWVHLQTVPPGSGRRVYIPSSATPQADPLPGEINGHHP